MADGLGEGKRWDVAKVEKARADHSADVMRAVPFSASAGAIAFILQQQSDKLAWHVIAGKQAGEL
jgi:hypothetical protein